MSDKGPPTPEIRAKLCEIFGLDSSGIEGMELHIGPQSSTLTVHVWSKPKEMEKVVKFFEDYDIVKRGSSDG